MTRLSTFPRLRSSLKLTHLPNGLIILSLVFLAATVLKGNHGKTSICKSSSLAVLQGLGSDTRCQLDLLDHMNAMATQVGNV